MRERGFAIPMQAWAALGVLAVLAAAAVAFHAWRNGVEDSGYRRGLAEKQAEWDQAKLEQADLERRRNGAVERELAIARQDAETFAQAAEDFEGKWKEALREVRRSSVALGSCGSSAPAEPAVAVAGGARGADPAPAGGVAGEPAGSGLVAPDGGARVAGVHLHWRFVGLYDGAFTGLDGKPLSPAAAQLAAGAPGADAPSPYGLEELAEVAGDNGRKHSACRRDVANLRAEVERAAEAWDRASR